MILQSVVEWRDKIADTYDEAKIVLEIADVINNHPYIIIELGSSV